MFSYVFLQCTGVQCIYEQQRVRSPILTREFPILALHTRGTNPYEKVNPFFYHLDCPSCTFASGFLPTCFCPQCPTIAFVQIGTFATL